MIRVTFVSYDDVPALGGQGRMLDELRRGLRARGHDVTTIAGRGENALRYPVRTGRAPLDFSLFLRRHPALLTRAAPDLVHIFGGPGGVLFDRPLPVPVVYHAHHTYRQAHGRRSLKRLMSPVEARVYRRAARVLAVSRSTALAVEAMRVPAHRIAVVPTGVEVSNEAKREAEPKRVLFVGRLEPEKGVLDAVSVMASLVRTRPDVEGRIVGSGRLEQVVRERARRTPRMALLGAVDQPALEEEYARAALLVMPSRYEGLGRTALEAQAAGTPVVGYDVTGLRDAVGEGGVLVPAGDVAALRVACVDLLDDPARRASLGARGREFVRRQYAPAAILDCLEHIYADVLKERPRVDSRPERPPESP